MPNVESIKKDIQALGIAGQEAIFKYLEEVVVLGSFATEVTNEPKTTDFQRGMSVLIVGMIRFHEMESTMEIKDISVNPVKRLLLTLHVLHTIIARKTLKSGYSMLNV